MTNKECLKEKIKKVDPLIDKSITSYFFATVSSSEDQRELIIPEGQSVDLIHNKK